MNLAPKDYVSGHAVGDFIRQRTHTTDENGIQTRGILHGIWDSVKTNVSGFMSSIMGYNKVLDKKLDFIDTLSSSLPVLIG